MDPCPIGWTASGAGPLVAVAIWSRTPLPLFWRGDRPPARDRFRLIKAGAGMDRPGRRHRQLVTIGPALAAEPRTARRHRDEPAGARCPSSDGDNPVALHAVPPRRAAGSYPARSANRE